MSNFLSLVISPPADNLLYSGSYNYVLVGFSILISVLASYAALQVSQFVSSSTRNTLSKLWIIGGGLSLGLGIWAMHFVGMLAFSLPCASSYDGTLTALSTIPGIIASVLALAIISYPKLSTTRLLLGGLLMGAGIGAMHYTGMAAMQLNGLIRYDIKLFLLSIVVAVVLATFALWVKFRLQAAKARLQSWSMPISAVLMGLAVSGMHYTAMAAAYFVRGEGVGAIESGITPSFLSATVLASTGLIITLTIFATYLGKPNVFLAGRPYRLIAVLVSAWGVIAWLSADHYYNQESTRLYQHSLEQVSFTAEQLSGDIADSLATLKVVTLVVSRGIEVREALRRFGSSEIPAKLAYEDRKKRWSEEATLYGLSQYFVNVAENLNTDNVFVLNAAGDCVASSNVDEKDSFVGVNYADRAYFKQAKAGGRGYQYAVGRASSVPGLFYSYPVFYAGEFIGAVVIKRSIARYASWINQANAFLTDNNGVIVLAQDKKIEFHHMPDASVLSLSKEKIQLQYKKDLIEPLSISSWKDNQFPLLVRLGEGKSPALLVSKSLPNDGINVYAIGVLREIDQHEIAKIWLFIVLASVGGMLIVAAVAVVLYLRESQRTKADMRIAATAFDAQEGMLITDANNMIIRVNRAFTMITGYSAEEAIGQNPRLFKSGRHDASFYVDMWARIVNQGSWEGECWNRRKNGEVYPEFLTITAVKDAHGLVENYVATFNDITLNKLAEEEIRNLAFYDSLTHLPNRRLLVDRMRQAIASCARNQREGALLFIDLDNFKSLNDTLGHSTGDLLLQQVALRLTECVREGDTVARLGGDEFIVMLEDLSAEPLEAAAQTEAVAEKILVKLNQPYLLGGHEYRNTPSIGATLFANQRYESEELMKQADIAMYQAKSAGRNTLRFFDPKMQEKIDTRAILEDALRSALIKNEFQLHYQIQIDIANRPVGAEALIRWNSAILGNVPPVQFIPLAEETGLMLPIGQWVIEAACAQLQSWQSRMLMQDLVLSINVSARQFRQDAFATQVQSLIDKYEINPRLLKIELTESMLVDDVEHTIATMNSLKTVGVQFSLDDFGTGYSSLQYLKQLPLNQIKIDQSFVRDIAHDSNDRAIVRTIIAMADSLGLDVIAEGVETEEQLELLKNKGCKKFQGYLFSKPLPLAQFEAILQQG